MRNTKQTVHKCLPRKPKTHTVLTAYLRCIYDMKEHKRILNKLSKTIKKINRKTPIEAIAFAGMSGAAVAFPLSVSLRIPLICIRKYRSSHFTGTYEGAIIQGNYVIIDDLVDSGDTIRRIHKNVKKVCCDAKLVGVLLYNQELGRDNCYEYYFDAPVYQV